MKKILLSAVLVAMLIGCSKDEETKIEYVPVAQEQSCEIKVFQIGTNFNTGVAVHYVSYGTNNQNLIHQEVDQANYDFYNARFNAQNYTWLGIQDL